MAQEDIEEIQYEGQDTSEAVGSTPAGYTAEKANVGQLKTKMTPKQAGLYNALFGTGIAPDDRLTYRNFTKAMKQINGKINENLQQIPEFWRDYFRNTSQGLGDDPANADKPYSPFLPITNGEVFGSAKQKYMATPTGALLEALKQGGADVYGISPEDKNILNGYSLQLNAIDRQENLTPEQRYAQRTELEADLGYKTRTILRAVFGPQLGQHYQENSAEHLLDVQQILKSEQVGSAPLTARIQYYEARNQGLPSAGFQLISELTSVRKQKNKSGADEYIMTNNPSDTDLRKYTAFGLRSITRNFVDMPLEHEQLQALERLAVKGTSIPAGTNTKDIDAARNNVNTDFKWLIDMNTNLYGRGEGMSHVNAFLDTMVHYGYEMNGGVSFNRAAVKEFSKALKAQYIQLPDGSYIQKKTMGEAGIATNKEAQLAVDSILNTVIAKAQAGDILLHVQGPTYQPDNVKAFNSLHDATDPELAQIYRDYREAQEDKNLALAKQVANISGSIKLGFYGDNVVAYVEGNQGTKIPLIDRNTGTPLVFSVSELPNINELRNLGQKKWTDKWGIEALFNTKPALEAMPGYNLRNRNFYTGSISSANAPKFCSVFDKYVHMQFRQVDALPLEYRTEIYSKSKDHFEKVYNQMLEDINASAYKNPNITQQALERMFLDNFKETPILELAAARTVAKMTNLPWYKRTARFFGNVAGRAAEGWEALYEQGEATPMSTVLRGSVEVTETPKELHERRTKETKDVEQIMKRYREEQAKWQ